MGRTLEYPKTSIPNNKLNRHNDRGTYDLGTIHSIINTTSVLHVSFSPGPSDPFPAILPMIGVMGSYEYPSSDISEPMDCYLHGYVSSRIMNLARASGEGLPICVAATKVDGLVLSLTPNSHSYNYRSAILHGYAKLVESVDEKLYAMRLVTNSVMPERWENTRTPPDSAEMQSTVVLKVKVVSGSGKIRDGGPHDEAKDEKRADLTKSIWTGVVPVYETLGQPVPSGSNKVEDVPEYIRRYVAETSKSNEAYSMNAARKP